MSALSWLLAALACYRATLLICADEILEEPRYRLGTWLDGRRHHKLADLLVCPWCVSVWLAPAAVGSGLAWADGWGWQLAAGALAASALTGALATFASPQS